MLQAMNTLSAAVKRNEVGRNDLMEQVLKQKLGNIFLITHNL